MNRIRILHLFPRLLSLYGEYGNPAILKKLLSDSGFECEITAYEDGILDLNEFDLIYIGSGTERAVEHATKKLSRFSTEIKSSVEGGKVWLSTGNSLSIFGKSISNGSETIDALGIFDFEAEYDSKKRYSGDVLSSSDNIFQARLVGYVNTAYVYSHIVSPLMSFQLGKKLGNDKEQGNDGLTNKNFFATQLTGPFLVKNPAAAEFFITLLTGKEYTIHSESYIKMAYRSAVEELSARL